MQIENSFIRAISGGKYSAWEYLPNNVFTSPSKIQIIRLTGSKTGRRNEQLIVN
jgi:hypothetical protein